MRCLLLLPLVLWSIVGRIVRASEDEFRLLRDLKEDYDPIERPVQNHSDAVDVQLRVILQQILDVVSRDIVVLHFCMVRKEKHWSSNILQL